MPLIRIEKNLEPWKEFLNINQIIKVYRVLCLYDFVMKGETHEMSSSASCRTWIMKSYNFTVHAQSDEAEVTISDKSENYPQNFLCNCPENCPENYPENCPENCPKYWPKNCLRNCPKHYPWNLYIIRKMWEGGQKLKRLETADNKQYYKVYGLGSFMQIKNAFSKIITFCCLFIGKWQIW